MIEATGPWYCSQILTASRIERLTISALRILARNSLTLIARLAQREEALDR